LVPAKMGADARRLGT